VPGPLAMSPKIDATPGIGVCSTTLPLPLMVPALNAIVANVIVHAVAVEEALRFQYNYASAEIPRDAKRIV
jgi:hypothetical protein